MPAESPRTASDVIRQLDRPGLVTLLRTRPDLAQPRPASLAEVVERAATTASTRAALDSLDAWSLRVAEALASVPDTISTRRLAALLEADASAVDQAVHALRQRALAWGTDRTLRLTQTARAAFGAHPAGLSSPSPAPLAEPDIDALLGVASPEELALVDKLLWHSPVGRVAGADRPHSTASTSPAERLLARRLLRAIDGETVVLPREVALRRRGGRLFASPVASSVPGWGAGSDSRVFADAALGQAMETITLLAAVCAEVERLAPRPLASGGISKRDQAALGRGSGAGQRTGWLLAVAADLGLIASAGSRWGLTDRFDQWLRSTTFEQWRAVVEVWPRISGCPLSEEAMTPDNPRLRGAALAELRAAPVGAAITSAQLAARVAWRHPTWPADDAAFAAHQVIDEASMLGWLALGRRTGLVDALDDPGFPPPAEQVIIQSDLTAIAPGPLAAQVARTLDLVADRESPGPASVHRFTAASIRRALDAGWQASALLEWLATHSTTPLPQPLTYLVNDVARQHGRIRVAAVAALLTVDDESLAASLLRHPRAAELGLRAVSPTVLAAQAEPVEVVELLRELGHAPVAESAAGSVASAPAPRRLRAAVPAEPPRAATTDQLRQLADDLLDSARRSESTAQTASLMETLVSAQTSARWLRMVHVDDQGLRRTDRVRVLAVVGGRARLVAKGKGQFLVALPRIVSAEFADEASAEA